MTRVAAIDCGTNSIRLLIADVDAAGTLTDVTRLMRIVRLGQGVDKTGRLDERALARTFEAVDEYAGLCAEHGVQSVSFVATSATRDADNRADFVAGVERRLGVAPEVVTGAQEALLSFSGALSRLAPTGEATLVVDIGGGSSELVLGTDRPDAEFSMNIGCVRMTERHLASDPPTDDQIDAARRDVEAALDGAERHVDLARAERLIGLAGSVTTITAHALGLPAYDSARIDGTFLDARQIAASCSELLRAPRAARAGYGFMHPGRVDVIGGGAIIWDAIVRRVAARTGVAGAFTSEHDILDGIALKAAGAL